MASPAAASPTLAASNGEGIAGGATLNKPTGGSSVPGQRPPTPPTSDTDRESGLEPFPTLDPGHEVAADFTEDPLEARGGKEATTTRATASNDCASRANVQSGSRQGTTDTPELSLATTEIAQQPQQQEYLDVDTTTSPRSQTSPVIPPYWNHASPSPERRPFSSSSQPGTAGQHSAQQNGHHSFDASSSPSSTPTVSPTYYQPSPRSSSDRPAHNRSISSASIDSLVAAAGGITLRDNENSSLDDRGDACWARSVAIRDYVVVNGGTGSIGAFVVWNIRVETLNGSYMNICKRYSEFDDLRSRLLRGFPRFEGAVPELPPKSLISKFRPSFLEKRRAGLQYFLNCIMLNPEFSGSPILKEFLFS
ncbi:Phox homologous domain-containing protein [Microdochium bolleyi]|uniref:Endosomal/vacuolar adapter protein YPT35 n=1 Tax=Microdochium bolleyi TaxID=196109 RepID=A0A136J2M4_9PEZI|nr:Phox homologous domain-containing protein [Microdochium bolleyi]